MRSLVVVPVAMNPVCIVKSRATDRPKPPATSTTTTEEGDSRIAAQNVPTPTSSMETIRCSRAMAK